MLEFEFFNKLHSSLMCETTMGEGDAVIVSYICWGFFGNLIASTEID
jgi:hypothetical protein